VSRPLSPAVSERTLLSAAPKPASSFLYRHFLLCRNRMTLSHQSSMASRDERASRSLIARDMEKSNVEHITKAAFARRRKNH
jgi:hypothetical protein